ncbi:SEC-C domain-containing protein [Flavobacterium hibisci]|nr:SEC-C domain-containing protein [Flavobacterium hibisci]
MDPTYLAFFTSYIFNPSDYQKELIENLYDKGYVDFSVNGDYDDLFEIVEPEKNIITVFELNDELINFEKGNQSDFNSKLFEEFNKYQKNGATIVLEKKINRNDPCPCGSGKKYKKCCLS